MIRAVSTARSSGLWTMGVSPASRSSAPTAAACARLVGFGQDDRKVRRAVCIQESHRVGVADGLAETFGQFTQQAFDLDLLELPVDVLGVVQLDDQHG